MTTSPESLPRAGGIDLTGGLPYPPPHERHLYDPTAAPITRFAAEWAFLSNFHPAVFDYQGTRWASSEHAFNGMKTLNRFERDRVAKARTAREAKERGRLVTLRPEWDTTVRYLVMDEVLAAKFGAHPARVQALLSTGAALLVEGTTWHDTHWGMCTCTRHGGRGENHLGRALMRLRATLA